MRIEEVASTSKSQRVATHTHIKGLGLDATGNALPEAAGPHVALLLRAKNFAMSLKGEQSPCARVLQTKMYLHCKYVPLRRPPLFSISEVVSTQAFLCRLCRARTGERSMWSRA